MSGSIAFTRLFRWRRPLRQAGLGQSDLRRARWIILQFPLLVLTTIVGPAKDAVAAGRFNLSPNHIGFGNVAVGGSGTKVLNLSNNSKTKLTVVAANVNGNGFTLSGPSLPLTLAAGQSTTFSVTFTPSVPGPCSGSVTVTDNASNSQTVNMVGTGTAPSVGLAPGSLSFGNQVVGTTSSAQNVTLTNTGNASLSISSVTIGGVNAGDFAQTNNCGSSVAAGANCSFSVSFTPGATGSRSATLTISDNAAGSPQTTALSGTGSTILISVSPGSTDFGDVAVGSSSSLPILITNTGTASVTLSQTTVTGAGFSVNGLALPFTLPSGQNTSLNVVFSPTTAGSVTGSVSVLSNATNSPGTEPLSGTGTQTHGVSLSWTASTSPGVVGYNVYRAIVSGGPYAEANSSPVPNTTYVDSTVQGGQTYYYVATAVDSAGKESAYSNEAQAAVPSP